MKLAKAQEIGWEVIRILSPGCTQIALAGSVRREKSQVKDVEIVYTPQMLPVDFWGQVQKSAMPSLLLEMINQGQLSFDPCTPRNGPKYKRLLYEGMVVELFKASKENWGLIYALRTGPAEFNHWLVKRMGGAMPIEMRMSDGWLWRNGKKLPTPTEEVFFKEIGVPCWPPEERSKERLLYHLKNR